MMIPEFYRDKEIFLTGGSGIVGTALIEQLLRSCDVRKIYLLLRPKKGMTLEQRLDEVKEKVIFTQLKLQKPYELDEKLAAIAGDAMLPMLGITDASVKTIENVSIFYHCAATVRFDEPLRQALKLNVGGTLEALKIAHILKKLKVFMHVSTFFCNPYLTKVEAKFYEAPMDWKLCLRLLERNDIDDKELDAITKKLTTGFPNTYTFTKNLAESLVNDHKDQLPVCIYRPSIVFFAVENPEPGFSPSFMGLMGLWAVIGAGLLKTIYVDKSTRLDISPQDIVVKNMLYYTVKASQIYEKFTPHDIPVYITSSDTHMNLNLTDYLNKMNQFGIWEKAAYEKNLLLPNVYHTSSRLLYLFLVTVLQILPALFVDIILILTGRQPILMRVQRKLFQTLEVMKPFMFNNYYSDGITDYEVMNKQCEGTNFSSEIFSRGSSLYSNLSTCFEMVLSVRRLLFKEDPKSLPRARRIFKIKLWLLKFIQFYIIYRVYLLILKRFFNL